MEIKGKSMKFSIIGGDIHKLVVIKENEDWAQYAWRIFHEKNLYWVPVPNSNDGTIGLDYDKSQIFNRINYKYCIFKT